MLSIQEKDQINSFIATHQPSNLPLINHKTKLTIEKTFKDFIKNNYDLVIFGSEGFSYTNGFYKNNNIIYIVTFYYGNVESYSFYKEGFEKN